MYSIYDYLHNGIVFVNNIVRKQHKELTSLMIYSTTNCQSRCRHCSIWKKPMENLSLDDIIKIMDSKCITKTHNENINPNTCIFHLTETGKPIATCEVEMDMIRLLKS